jgi:hypothetical protein
MSETAASLTIEDLYEAARRIEARPFKPMYHTRPPAAFGHDCPLCFDAATSSEDEDHDPA